MIKENKMPPFGVIVGGLVSLILFSFLMGSIIYFYIKNPDQSVYSKQTQKGLMVYDLTSNASTYHNQLVTVQGKVNPVEVVCQKVGCPVTDNYCGCPDKRELLLLDTGRVVRSTGIRRLRLTNTGGSPLCKRIENTQDYTCQDWVKGGIYQITGTFMVDNPAAGTGTNFGLEYYLIVQGKTQLNNSGFGTTVTSYIGDLWQWIVSWTDSGGYVVR